MDCLPPTTDGSMKRIRATTREYPYATVVLNEIKRSMLAFFEYFKDLNADYKKTFSLMRNDSS
jgi:hypothetical protein